MRPAILIVEDEPKLAELLQKYLAVALFGRVPWFFPNAFAPGWTTEGLAVYHEGDPASGRGRLRTEGFEPHWVATGEAAVTRQREAPAALVILDVGLPDLSGFEVFKRLRAFSDVPVVFLTARTDEIDRVVGLELGADDYVAKPFQMEEVIARIEALIRRAHGIASAVLNVGPLTLDTTQNMVFRDGNPIIMTPLEYRLAAYLMMRRGAVISKTEITEHIYDQNFDRDSNVVEVLINRLRKKLGTDAIETRRGQGYVLAL